MSGAGNMVYVCMSGGGTPCAGGVGAGGGLPRRQHGARAQLGQRGAGCAAAGGRVPEPLPAAPAAGAAPQHRARQVGVVPWLVHSSLGVGRHCARGGRGHLWQRADVATSGSVRSRGWPAVLWGARARSRLLRSARPMCQQQPGCARGCVQGPGCCPRAWSGARGQGPYRGRRSPRAS